MVNKASSRNEFWLTTRQASLWVFSICKNVSPKSTPRIRVRSKAERSSAFERIFMMTSRLVKWPSWTNQLVWRSASKSFCDLSLKEVDWSWLKKLFFLSLSLYLGDHLDRCTVGPCVFVGPLLIPSIASDAFSLNIENFSRGFPLEHFRDDKKIYKGVQKTFKRPSHSISFFQQISRGLISTRRFAAPSESRGSMHLRHINKDSLTSFGPLSSLHLNLKIT